MPPTSTAALITDDDMEDSSFMDKMKHQQLLLYIVCGLGGFCLLLVFICVVCKCKSARDNRKAEERRKNRLNSKGGKSKGRGNSHRGSKVKPEELKRVRESENRSRKRSLDMRNGTRQNGEFKQMSIEEFSGEHHM